MSNLDTKSKYINIVISQDNFISNYQDLKSFERYCIQYFLHYAFIVHDKDRILVEKPNLHYEDKHKHLHLVGILKDSKRFSTILNQLRDYFKLDNLDAINIEKMLSIEGSIQYLIHKNDSDKHQYDKKNIIHNLGSDLDTYLDMSSIELTYKKLKDIIINADNLLDVIQMLGLPRYNQYRHVVYDMWQLLKLPKRNELQEYAREREVKLKPRT